MARVTPGCGVVVHPPAAAVAPARVQKDRGIGNMTTRVVHARFCAHDGGCEVPTTVVSAAVVAYCSHVEVVTAIRTSTSTAANSGVDPVNAGVCVRACPLTDSGAFQKQTASASTAASSLQQMHVHQVIAAAAAAATAAFVGRLYVRPVPTYMITTRTRERTGNAVIPHVAAYVAGTARTLRNIGVAQVVALIFSQHVAYGPTPTVFDASGPEAATAPGAHTRIRPHFCIRVEFLT